MELDDMDSGQGLRVRSCRADEVAAVLDLWVKAGAHPTATDDPEAVHKLLEHDPDALLVAEWDGHVVGTLIAAWDGWRGTFFRLAVVPEMRLRGIGRALLHEGERRLRARGARRLSAIVVASDSPAAAFWERTGYARQEARFRFVKNLSEG